MTQTADKYVLRQVAASLARNGIETFEGGTVYAYVNHDRWVADCPCNGAERVAPGHRMVCGSCGADHQVVFPDEQLDIDRLLALRPIEHRHWQPGETLADLKAENIDYGVETP